MKIALVSDLHLEFESLELVNEGADVLVMAGDILNARGIDEHVDFLDQVSSRFSHVLWVAGNHEFYGGRWNKSIQILRDYCHRYPNVHFLERNVVTIDGVVFVGGTLWTNLDRGNPLALHAAQGLMNDYRQIKYDGSHFRKLLPSDTAVRHRETLEYFDFVLKENRDKPCVVVSHHAPTSKSVHPRWNPHDLSNHSYYSNLGDFILDHPEIVLWCHGHTHDDFDYTVGTTRVLCNPRGYRSYDEGFKGYKVKYIEIKYV
jgi:3',5'-cyclic AMP phosphodiesterase CpdA